jgi:NACHT domain
MTGFEPVIIDAAAKALAGVFIKSAWDGGGNWFGRMKLSESVQQLVYDATRKYVESYHQRHGKIKVLGMREPLNLENIYTAVQSIDRRDIWRYASLAEQEEAYRGTDNRNFQSDRCEKEDGIKIANRHQYLMILGQPGAGKSTFLRWIGLQLVKGKKSQYQYPLIPVFIELKLFNSGEIDLIKTISEELKICGFPKPEESTQKLLNGGKLLILLDGLDEIPSEHLDKSMQQIQNFVDKYSRNRFIASCRIAAHSNGFQQFTDVEIADFDDRQIQEFINNWFSREQDRQLGIADACWQSLSSPDYTATKELAHNPLLLTFLCLVFDDAQVFPKNRADLYRDALDILLKKWAAEKKIQRNPIYKDLTLTLEEMMLAKIAYEQFSQNRLFFDEATVIREICDCLSNNLNAPKHLDGKDVLLAIQVQQGILVERSRNILSFSHLTLQEYLTAKHIVDNNLIDELVRRHLTNDRWREVFLLVAGLMRGGADPLLEKMVLATGKLIDTDKLRALVNWADSSTQGVDSQVNHLARRHLALLIANANANAYANANAIVYANAYTNANAYANAIAYAIAYDNAIAIANSIANSIANANAYANANANTHAYANGYAIAIAIAIDKSIDLIDNLVDIKIFRRFNHEIINLKILQLKQHMPGKNADGETYQKFAAILVKTWFEALEVRLEWLNLSGSEISDLNRCFAGNLLIMRCKEAAISVSPNIWSQVEEKMFHIL